MLSSVTAAVIQNHVHFSQLVLCTQWEVWSRHPWILNRQGRSGCYTSQLGIWWGGQTAAQVKQWSSQFHHRYVLHCTAWRSHVACVRATLWSKRETLHWLLLMKAVSDTYTGIWACNSYFKCTYRCAVCMRSVLLLSSSVELTLYIWKLKFHVLCLFLCCVDQNCHQNTCKMHTDTVDLVTHISIHTKMYI